MSTKTTNYEFVKPEKTDPADITATNENWDKIDVELSKVSSRVDYELSTNIKDYASTLDQGFYAVRFTGASYSGTDLPTGNYKYGSAIINVRTKGNVITIILLGSESYPPQFAYCNDGVWSEWSTQYLPLNGGILKGNLDFKKVDNGSATIYKNHSSTADYGLIIRDVAPDGNYNQLILSATDNTLQYRDTTGEVSRLFGEHNFALKAGDTLPVTINTAGILTSNGTQLQFTVPLSKPVIGSPKITPKCNNGFMLLQGGKYTHGTSSSARAFPDTFTASYVDGVGVRLVATFSNTTNAVNNDTIAIYWHGRLEFS